MRKIVSKKDKEKIQKRNRILGSIILVIIMFFSTIGYSFMNRGSGSEIEMINYNGIDFFKQGEYWLMNSQIGDFYFKYNPKQTKDTPNYLSEIESYSGKPIYVYTESEEAYLEIYRNLEPFAQRIQQACLENKECVGNYPIKNCNDTLIIIQESQEEDIYEKDNCVFIKGKKENLTMLSDEFLFKIFGIKEQQTLKINN